MVGCDISRQADVTPRRAAISCLENTFCICADINHIGIDGVDVHSGRGLAGVCRAVIGFHCMRAVAGEFNEGRSAIGALVYFAEVTGVHDVEVGLGEPELRKTIGRRGLVGALADECLRGEFARTYDLVPNVCGEVVNVAAENVSLANKERAVSGHLPAEHIATTTDVNFLPSDGHLGQPCCGVGVELAALGRVEGGVGHQHLGHLPVPMSANARERAASPTNSGTECYHSAGP